MRIVGRPFGIIALAVLAVGGGLWARAGVAGLHDLRGYSLKSVDVAPEVVRGIIAGWAVALLAGALPLLALHRWGWVLLMLATGLGLLGSLWQWWLESPTSTVWRTSRYAFRRASGQLPPAPSEGPYTDDWPAADAEDGLGHLPATAKLGVNA
jgi:hypothetical protein